MDSKTYPQEPAFPISHSSGLTKQEYFAAIALQGLLANGAHRLQSQETLSVKNNVFAEVAVELADLLIEKLNKSNCNHSESTSLEPSFFDDKPVPEFNFGDTLLTNKKRTGEVIGILWSKEGWEYCINYSGKESGQWVSENELSIVEEK